MRLKYDEIKSFIQNDLDYKHLLQTVNNVKYYSIFVADGSFSFECYINDTDHASDVSDFETNFLSGSNVKINQHNKYESTTNRQDIKICKVIGDLRKTFIYFTTGDDESLDNGGETYYVISCPDSTHTYIDFIPEYDYSLTGGEARVVGSPANDIKIGFIIAPNIPEAYGGNWPIVNNRKFINTNDEHSISVDSKYFRYNSEVPEASRVRLAVTHDASESCELEFSLEMFI